MELREKIEDINKKLLDEFGVELQCGNKPRFRVVFSEDQYEKRWTEYSPEGFQLIEPIVVELPKYKQWIKSKYILERLIPIVGETDLVEKTSYEPAWVFQDKNGNYLPPFFEGCRFVIEALFTAMGRKDTYVKYKDKNVSEEERRAHLKKVEDELFGNETEIGDHLSYGTGVSLANTSKVESESKLVH
jgi:hypothetical protein